MTNDGAIVVFGATGGIGSALCKRRHGRANLLLCARSEVPLRELSAALPGSVPFAADATHSDSVGAAFDMAERQFGRVDGAVNCVGSILLKPAHLTTDDDWHHALTANLTSAFLVLRRAVESMTRSRVRGSVVLVSSSAASVGIANHEAVAAAKAGIVGLMRAAAATYAHLGIRVNCVAPGLTRTPLTKTLTSSPAVLGASAAMHPLGRIGEADEVASAIDWLLDTENSFVTGQVLAVDGGLSSLQPRSVRTNHGHT